MMFTLTPPTDAAGVHAYAVFVASASTLTAPVVLVEPPVIAASVLRSLLGDRDGHAHRERAGQVGRDHLADGRVGRARRLAEEAGHEAHLEHAEAEAAAGLLGQPLDHLVAARLEESRRP